MDVTNTIAPGLTLDERMENRQRLTRIAAETKKQLDAENAAIKDAMIGQGIDEYPVGEHKFVLSLRPGRASLDKGKLVALGVDTEVIENAMVVGDDYFQLDVRKAGEVA